jgi:Domain of unknown function (DUF4365)
MLTNETLNDLKAEFAQAYVRAVAHAGGFFVDEAGRLLDAAGVDLQIFSLSWAGTRTLNRLDVQIKATALLPEGDPFSYDLPIKNYEELRLRQQTPRILIVVKVPEDSSQWLRQNDQETILKCYGFWKSLEDEPESDNNRTQRIKIPRASRFDVEILKGLMQRISHGARS